MSFWAFGGGESGEFGVYLNGGGTTLVTSPALAGTYSFKTDPVNIANGQYGPTSGFLLITKPKKLSVMFLYRFAAEFSDAVAIAELGGKDLNASIDRRISMDTNEKLLIVDNSDDEVGSTANNYLAINTTYPMLWYFDQTDSAKTRDILWVYKSGAWDKAIDVSNYGNALNVIEAITFGSRKGKTAPTSGGPYYTDELCVQIFDRWPNTSPIGSVTTRVKSPTANGTDQDFTLGTGTNPNWQDVDDIPADDATTTDASSTSGHRVSYAVADTTAGDTPLAVQVIGIANPNSGGNDWLNYLYDGTTRDESPVYDKATGWSGLLDQWENWAFDQFNGRTWSTTIFDGIEVGIKNSLVGTQSDLSAIFAEYVTEGPYPLPSGFPRWSLPHIRPGLRSVASPLLRR